MKKIKIIRVFNLVDSHGDKLQLELGMIDHNPSDCIDPVMHGDTGLRWRFIGKSIPMPIRSRTWFNGFPENVMLEWLKTNGWYPRTRVDMCDGNAYVYELPNSQEDINRSEEDEQAFCEVIRNLKRNGKNISAVRLYRYANGGSLGEAYNAVKKICGID